MGKFIIDKKSAYEAAMRDHDAVKKDYDEKAGFVDAAQDKLEEAIRTRENAETALKEAMQKKASAIKAAEEAERVCKECPGADKELLERFDAAAEKTADARTKADSLKETAALKKQELKDAENSVRETANKYENIKNDKSEKLLSDIRRCNDNAALCRLMVQYGLYLEKGTTDVVFEEAEDSELPDSMNYADADKIFKAVYNKTFDYFSYNIEEKQSGTNVSVVRKGVSYKRADAVLLKNQDGSFSVNNGSTTTKINTPVVETKSGYGVAVNGKVRKLREQTADSRYGVVNTSYEYDENKMEKTVKINKVGSEHCDIVEIFTADVSATENIRENFNISKDAEERKKELEREGYTTGLNQVNSSGYKTYRITATKELPVKKMEVQRIDYRLMDEYCCDFEEDCLFISQEDILNGNDKYQREVKNLETELKTAKEIYDAAVKNEKQAQDEFDKAELAVQTLSAYMEKLEKQVQETDSDRQALLKQVQSCKAAAEAAEAEILEKKEALNAASRAVEDADTEIFRKKADIHDLIEAVEQSQQKLELAKKEFDKADKVGSDSRNKIKAATEKLQSLEEQKEKLTGDSKNSKSGSGGIQRSLKDRFQGLKSAFAKEERGYRV
jgi:hypothetical protein